MGRRLKFGLGKEVFDAVWNDHKVAYVRLRPERLHQGPIRDRVRTGIQHLIQLQPSPYVTKVLGMIDCEKNGVASHVTQIFTANLSFKTRLKLVKYRTGGTSNLGTPGLVLNLS